MIVRPSRLIREILLAEGVCQSLPAYEWRCVTVKMPDGVGTVDDMVVIVDRDDIEVGRYITDSNYQFLPHVQVVVRGVGLGRCYDKMREITNILDAVHNYSVIVDGDEYVVIGTERTTNVAFNGVDGTGKRYVHTIEYNLILR